MDLDLQLLIMCVRMQGHMMWLKRQDSFKEKFGTFDEVDHDKHTQLGEEN